MRNVAVQPEATKETDDAMAWYEEKEPGLGLRFLHDLELIYAAIARRPESFQLVKSGFRRALMRRFPFAIFYEFDQENVLVHSVFHCSRNPTILRTRLMRSKKRL